jgi:cytoskeleton protein RodZ
MAIDSNFTLGQYLRHEREHRGLTIEQVASATKIGIRTLHALEGDHYAELPAKPFIRGFVISYARFIGLDHKETLTHFNAFLDDRVQQERPNREGGHSGYAFEKREGDQSRMVLGITMGGFVLVGAVAMFFLKPTLGRHHGSRIDKLRAGHEGIAEVVKDGKSEPSAVPVLSASTQGLPDPTARVSSRPAPAHSAVAAISPMVEASPSPSPSNIASLTPPVVVAQRSSTPSPSPDPTSSPSPSPAPTSALPDPLNSGFGLKQSETQQRIVCKAIDSVWVRYRVDDKALMQFVLKKDKVLVLRGRQSVILQVGEPEHLDLSVNGGAHHVAAKDRSNALRDDDATLFFPAQLAKSTDEPFPGESALSTRKSPSSIPAPDLSAPGI